MDAAGKNPALSLPVSSWPPNAHTSDFLEAHGERSQSQQGLLRDSLVFYSKVEEGKVILFQVIQLLSVGNTTTELEFFPDFLWFTHKNFHKSRKIVFF